MQTQKLSTQLASANGSWLKRHGQKIAALAFWLLLLGAYVGFSWRNNLTPLGAVQALIAFIAGSVYGPLIYIAIYTVRPLTLFSATLLTLAGGFVFGPLWGMLYVVIGANLSALVAYGVGRFFGQGFFADGESSGLLARYAERLRRNSFESTFLMRLIFLPYDLVNYLAGFLRINWQSFILATALGSLPGTLAFVLAGASIERFDGGIPAFNPWTLVAAIVIFLISLVLSRIFKRREGAA